MENFTNSVLLPENLPETDPQSFNLLDRNYLKILFIRLFIFLILAIGGFIAFISFSEGVPGFVRVIIALALGLILLYSAAITHLGFPRKGYLVREKDISYQKGIIFYKLITIPFNRIQHVEVNQGVINRAFKLASVKLYTAGGNAGDLSIPGLPEDVAEKIKEFLSEKISEHE